MLNEQDCPSPLPRQAKRTGLLETYLPMCSQSLYFEHQLEYRWQIQAPSFSVLTTSSHAATASCFGIIGVPLVGLSFGASPAADADAAAAAALFSSSLLLS